MQRSAAMLEASEINGERTQLDRRDRQTAGTQRPTEVPLLVSEARAPSVESDGAGAGEQHTSTDAAQREAMARAPAGRRARCQLTIAAQPALLLRHDGTCTTGGNADVWATDLIYDHERRAVVTGAR